jgi:hypothetical protein
MASPVYNTVAFRRRRTWGGGRHFGGRQRRWWGISLGSGSMFGGNTPHYLGAGQPTPDDGGESIGDGTPVYLTPRSTTAATTPSTTPSDPTVPQPATAMASQPATVVAPQPATTAILVPRS